MTKRMRLGLFASGAVTAAALTAWPVLTHQRKQEQAPLFSGTVEATEAQLGFPVPGRLETLTVREGDAVKSAAPLALLDRAEMQARRREAEGRLMAAQATLAELEHGSRPEEVAQARAALQSADKRLTDARRDLSRSEKLYQGQAIAEVALQNDRLAVQVALSDRNQAAEQLRLVKTGPRAERIEAQKGQLQQAEAALAAIDATLANMTLRSAFDGVVTVRHREPGEMVPAGGPVLTVMNPDDRWVRIYVPEGRLGAIRLGAPAQIGSDTFPGKQYTGEVSFIASEAEFTPKNVQTLEERVKLVYAVKVRITGDPSRELKPGMPADLRLALTPP